MLIVRRQVLGNPTVAVALVALAMTAPGCNGSGSETKTAATIALDGSVLLATGQPARVAHVVLEEPGGGAPEKLTVGDGGRFSAEVVPGGALELRIAAPDHEELTVPVCLTEEAGPASVTVTLASNPRPETFEDVRIIGDFNGFSFSSAEAMTRQEDGTWNWTRDGIDGDRFAYQLLGITTNGHSVNGTQSDWFEYDGGGDFRSVVTVKDGAVRIVFDPSKLPPIPEGKVEQVRWDEDHSDLTMLFDVLHVRGEVRNAVALAIHEREEETGSPEGLEFDWTPWRERLHAAAGEHPATLSQQVAFLLERSLGQPWPKTPDPGAAKAVVAAVPVDSPAWGFCTDTLQRLFSLAGPGEAGTAIARRFYDESPVGAVRTAALAALTAAARDAGDEATWRERYAMLKERVGDSREWKYLLASLDPDKKIRTGNPVPEFTVTLLDGSTLTSEDLKGHYTLIDFWATWCAPCVGEMPNLHEAWKKFHDRGFQILSLSLDRSPDDIATFRKKWPMPWKHAFLEKGFENQVVRQFEVMGIPTPVLIGPDGTIAATEPGTRGEQLIATLDALYATK